MTKKVITRVAGLNVFIILKSTHYKKLAPNALRFTYNLANHMKKQNKKH